MHTLRSLVESALLPAVEKPMRYAGSELHIVRKDLASVRVHGAFCFPDLYDIGMSHYGLQTLYHIVNSRERWALSRAFAPWPDAETVMRQRGIALYTLEYFTPIADADWIGFTLQYELQYANMLNMLDLAGLAVRARNRGENDPLVITGGPCMVNPEPIAAFADVCAIGDGEKLVVDICDIIETAREAGESKATMLRRFAETPGFYVPALHQTRRAGLFAVASSGPGGAVRAQKIARLEERDCPDAPLTPLIDVVHHRLAVEVMRGCTRGCRFCSAGSYYRPVRERSAASIRRQIERSVARTGWRDIGLLSLSTADYTAFDRLLASIEQLRRERRLNVSLPSTRIDALEREQVRALNAVSPASSFTIAPEAGSQRLRNVINKDFSEESILAAVRTLLDNNIQTLKLYFMIGLPTETDDDIDAIIALVRMIGAEARRRGRRRTVNVALSPFSPKAQTPFEREPMDSFESLLRKARMVKNAFAAERAVKVSYRDPHMTMLETIMARGDRRVGDAIEEAWRRGARFDGWDEFFDFARWRDALESCDIDFGAFLGPLDASQPLPWEHIDIGVSREYLARERERALASATSADCRVGACLDCGVCDPRGHDRAPVENVAETRTAGARAARPRPGVESPRFYYRFTYRKGEAMRFLPHRDMVNVIHRAFAAAGAPVAYSQGFHPHPRIAFGPPLNLGVIGERELFDAVMTRMIDAAIDLEPWLPDGLSVRAMRFMPHKPQSLNASIVAARYRIEPPDALREEIAARASAIVQRESVRVNVTKKGAPISKDIRGLIYSLDAVQGERGEVLQATVAMKPGATCRPDDLVAALFEECSPREILVAREACLAEGPAGLQQL